jgi:photosystem II stability/assembly factor-like uncharacterized protein
VLALLSMGALVVAGTALARAAGAASSAIVTRAQFVEALAQAAGLQPLSPAVPSFSDVPPSSPYYGFIEAAVKAGWIEGVSPGRFDPQGSLTRAQIAKIEVTALGEGSAALSKMTASTTFSDNGSIPSWARGYIVEAVRLGLIRGYPNGSFQPDAFITAAQEPLFLAQYAAAAAAQPHLEWQAIGPAGFANYLTADAPTTPSTGLAAAGKVGAVAVDYQNPQLMYLGAAGGDNRGPLSEAGVYMTQDGGTTWQPVDHGLTNTQVNDLWLDQSNPRILLAATQGGIFRSTDGGAAWSPVYPGAAVQFARIGTVLYAGTDAGVASSTDLGRTWTLVEPTPLPVSAITSAGPDLYVAAQNTLLKDSASGWQTVYTAPASAGDWIAWVVANPVNPSDVYFRHCPMPTGGGACTSELSASTDGGKTWSQLSVPAKYQIPQFDIQALAPDSTQPNTLYVGGNMVFSVSTDGGRQFTQTAVNVDIWYLKAWPGRAGTLLAGTDQGLYLVTDGGQHWQSLNGNLTTSLLYNVTVQGKTILAAVQDYSPFVSFDGSQTWSSQASQTAPSGEGGEDFIDPADPQVVLAIGRCCGLQVSFDGGKTFSPSQAVPAALFNQDPQAIAVGNEGQIYVASASGVYESTDGGHSFQPTGWPIAHPSFVAVGPAGAHTLFVGAQTAGGNASALDYSTDGGATWHQADLGGAAGYPATLAINPMNPQDVLLGMSLGPQLGGGILQSGDGGKSFAPADQGLAPVPQYLAGTSYPAVWQISYDPGSSLAVAATSNGLYALSSRSVGWISIRANATPFMFTGIAWSNGDIYVSTMGEGVLRAPAGSLTAP